MPANLTNPRPDIVYLRRRLKRGESVPTAAPAQTSSASRLSLARPSGDSPVTLTSPKEETPKPVSVPEAVGLSFLKETNDAFRLNKRQSAIGSLIIGNAMVAGWQTVDGASGYIYNAGVAVTESPEHTPQKFKKRALVEFHKDLLVVGLRNFRQLKRLIIVPKNGETLQAETLSGTGVVMDFEPFTALYVSVVDSVIEFRKEDFRGTITDTFNLHTVKPQNASPVPLRTLFSERER